MRIRDVFPNITIGRHPTGPLNSLTDVPGVLVHTESIRTPNTPTQHAVNTGVTTILPRKDWFSRVCHAGIFSFNGSGEMTGSHWIEETGLLRSPIILTNSFAVGPCYTGVYQHAIREHASPDGTVDWFLTPVIAETYDGYLSDIAAMPVTPDMVVRGIDRASAARVPEGCTGGGTGMVCQGVKGGTGSASRTVVAHAGETFTLAALVQANFGKDWGLTIGGVPVGRLLMDAAQRAAHEANLASIDAGTNDSESESTQPAKDGSIIVILATDAPLSPTQLKRLAKRATVGLAKTGGWGSNTSGDLFLAFSTACDIPGAQPMTWRPARGPAQRVLLDNSVNSLFECAADCVEESIYNAVCMAETTVGPMGRVVEAIDLDRLRRVLGRWCCTD